MMKSHGIASNAATIKPTQSRGMGSMKGERRGSHNNSPKKRKTDAFLDDENTADDDENYFNDIKPEPPSSGKEFAIKEEEQQAIQLSLNEATNLLQYYDKNPRYGFGAEVEDDTEIEEVCIGRAYGSGDSGYVDRATAALGEMLGTDNSATYGLSVSHGMDISNSSTHSSSGRIQYQPSVQYSSEDRRHFDSPVILE
jgi:hypothetical protein